MYNIACFSSPLEYELRDHLGNVRSTVSGLRLFDNTARISLSSVSGAKEYYPFGSIASQYGPQGYRWVYNGKELDKETGDRYDYGARLYDPSIAIWLSLNPLQSKRPFINPYNFCFEKLLGVCLDQNHLTNNPLRQMEILKMSIHAIGALEYFCNLGSVLFRNPSRQGCT